MRVNHPLATKDARDARAGNTARQLFNCLNAFASAESASQLARSDGLLDREAKAGRVAA